MLHKCKCSTLFLHWEHKVQSCTWWWELHQVMGAAHAMGAAPAIRARVHASCLLLASAAGFRHMRPPARYHLCTVWKVCNMSWRRLWHLGLPHFHLSFYEKGRLGTSPSAWAYITNLTRGDASPSRNPSWTSTGLLCSPVVQPWTQGNKSASLFLS